MIWKRKFRKMLKSIRNNFKLKVKDKEKNRKKIIKVKNKMEKMNSNYHKNFKLQINNKIKIL
jgi:hypothetical protein